MQKSDKKLTDTKTYNPCDDCPHSFSKNNQESNICKICEFKYFLGEINRLNAEIERLKEEKETLKSLLDSSQGRYFGISNLAHKYRNKYKTAKAEAYKECIKEAKSVIDNNEGHVEESCALRGSWDKKYFYDSEIEDILDDLLKEKIGEQ